MFSQFLNRTIGITASSFNSPHTLLARAVISIIYGLIL